MELALCPERHRGRVSREVRGEQGGESSRYVFQDSASGWGDGQNGDSLETGSWPEDRGSAEAVV